MAEKITLSDALDKATQELSGSESEKPQEEKTPVQEPEVQQEEAPAPEAPTTQEEPEAAATADEAVDTAVREAVGKKFPEQKATKEQLLDYLMDHFKNEIVSKGEKKKDGPMDVSEVDVNNPVSVQKYVDSRISHAVLSALQPIQSEMAMRQADMEFRKLFSDHPDAKDYGKQMAALVDKFPELPLEYAYRIAKSDGLVKEGVKKAYDSMAKKKSATLATSTVKSPVEAPKKPKSVREAVLMAMDETGASFVGE